VAVVGLVEDDRGLAGGAEPDDVAGGVVDVDVGADVGLVADEAQVAVGDAVLVEPRGRVRGRGLVGPVEQQPVGDDADPHARSDRRHSASATPGIGAIVRKMRSSRTAWRWAASKVLEAQPPLGVGVHDRLGRQRGGVAPELPGHRRAEGRLVVGADPVEVDPEHEPAVDHPCTARSVARDTLAATR
jgi:hypothetical protein